MNTLILTLTLIFGLSWIGSIIYYGIQSVRSFIRKDIWEFEDNIRRFFVCIFVGWAMPFVLIDKLFEYTIKKITDRWN